MELKKIFEKSIELSWVGTKSYHETNSSSIIPWIFQIIRNLSIAKSKCRREEKKTQLQIAIDEKLLMEVDDDVEAVGANNGSDPHFIKPSEEEKTNKFQWTTTTTTKCQI